MSGRRYQRVRLAGQDAPPLSMALAAALCWGEDLMLGGNGSGIAAPEGFELDRDMALIAWRAHDRNVLVYWAEYWASREFPQAPTCWAARVFDGVPQIEAPEDAWARDRIANIEGNV